MTKYIKKHHYISSDAIGILLEEEIKKIKMVLEKLERYKN